MEIDDGNPKWYKQILLKNRIKVLNADNRAFQKQVKSLYYSFIEKCLSRLCENDFIWQIWDRFLIENYRITYHTLNSLNWTILISFCKKFSA